MTPYSVTVHVPLGESLFEGPLEVRYYTTRELANLAAVWARDTLCALLDNSGAEDLELQQTRCDQEDIYAVDYRKGAPYAHDRGSSVPSRIRIVAAPATPPEGSPLRDKLA